MVEGNKLEDVFNKGILILKNANICAPVVEAGVLLCHVLKCDKTFLYTHKEYCIKENELKEILISFKKRAQGMPVQYLTGKIEFMSLDFEVNEHVLIPRQETETLVETVIRQCKLNKVLCYPKSTKGETPPIRVLDIGTGSGCIAVSLAHYIKNTHITAVDISKKAIEVARKNAKKNNVYDKIKFVLSDVYKNLEGSKFDIIVSNPPYVESGEIETLEKQVKNFEPEIALNGGKDGLDFYRKIVSGASLHLRPKGVLFLEVGFKQADKVKKIIKEKFAQVTVVKDLAGIERVLYGEGTIKPNSPKDGTR